MAIRVLSVALLALAALGGATPGWGQQTRSDSAAVVLDAAFALEREGRSEAARELLGFIGRRYAGTPAAEAAAARLRSLPRVSELGTGRTGFVLFNTLYGAFLGVAIPAALDADDSGPYGAGLLVGAPLGFFSSRAFARSRIRTAGQAGIASFAATWGTWLGLSVQQTLDLGSQEACYEFGCVSEESDTAPWTAMVVGGVAGLGLGYALAASREVANGTSSLVSHSAFWGTWFGVTLGRAALDAEDKDLWASAMVVGNAGLLAALPASRAWGPSSSRIRLITAAGIAGGLAGFGIDLLADVDDDRSILGIAAAGSAVGLVVGAIATRGRDDLDTADATDLPGASLVELRDGLRLGIPIPTPAAVRLWRPAGRSRTVPAARIPLFSATF